ncbi:MAG: 16S rRNA (adenine(1518)-N(6)/adenine(1519)-N(6))-dimethyltransferase RsmA [Marinilabiliaceae bacterium]|nr:16S rRNA (adenine(1518)-N(6)/adenine(1519)-N(6))-dimethyltransferase RsmA [Marinilabiliaceae bacterium]
MNKVRAKKHLGQHFLTDLGIAQKIVDSISLDHPILEIGPGMGVLTKFLIRRPGIDLHVIEIDRESVEYLQNNFPEIRSKIISGDFLKLDLKKLFPQSFSVIGNLPYNISSQIFFKVLENRNQVPELVAMIQKEVAQRIASAPKCKEYGILSVLLQAYYDIEYLFTVHEHVFSPPPKVKSAVIRLRRNNRESLGCNETLFKQVVKTTFNQRRKAIRNSIKAISFNREAIVDHLLLTKRPEHLSVDEFVELTNLVEQNPLRDR